MNNPQYDPWSSPLDSHTNTKKPSVKLVWLLNLIPYSGAGYIYALGGFKEAVKPMLFIWIFLLVFGPGTLVPMYFILSVLGTAHILNKNRSTVDKLRQATLGKDVDSVPPGQQIPMTASTEFSLSTLESKANKAKRALKRLSVDEDEAKSKHAFESFEYKAQAAEKMLKARNDATTADSFDPDPSISFAPAAAPNIRDQETDPRSGSYASQAVPVNDRRSTSAQSGDSSDYINQVNSSYSIDAEVASITDGVNRGASANTEEVDNFLVQESALNNSRIQPPNLVPEISSQVAQSDAYIPEVTAQYSAEPLALPSNTMSLGGFSAPDVSSQLVESNQSVPEVSSQLVDSNQFAPDISSQVVSSTQVTPDVSSQLADTSLTSFGNFESPKFSFSFEDHMATPLAGDAALGTASAATATPCPKCGAIRDSNFSFCLACGQSFL